MRYNDFVAGKEEPDGRPCQRAYVILVTGIPASGKKSPLRHPGHVTNSRYFKGEGAVPSPTITLEQYIAAIQAREMDNFCIGGPAITLDTTDFSKVDWEEFYREIEEFVLEKLQCDEVKFR